MLRVLVVLVCLAVSCRGDEFTLPEATLEPLTPKGLKISIPDTDPDVNLVAFHVNVNEEFEGVEAGQWAVDVIKRKDGRWTHTFPQVRVKKGDVVHYWVFGIRNGLGYQNLHRSYQVFQAPAPAAVALSPIDWRNCGPSSTTLHDGAQPCSGHTVFNSTFLTSGDFGQWQHEVFIGHGKDLDEDFTIFTKDSEVSKVSNGQLRISPILLEQKYSTDFVTTGTIELEGCTATDTKYCNSSAIAYLILPPVLSARLTTRKSFSFRYGTVEIKAKLPKGDWIVPELRLEPKTEHYGQNSGRIVMGLARGNERLTVEGKTIGNELLEAGVLLNTTDGPTFKLARKGGWADDFHVFKLLWTPDVLEFSVDGERVGRISPDTAVNPELTGGDKMKPFDREFFISLGVHVGGLTLFPDTAASGDQPKPWKNSSPKARLQFWQSKDQWFPSWTGDSALIVQYVKVHAL